MGDLYTVIAPSPDADWTEMNDSVALSRQKQGRVFRKHILSYGELIHPVTKTKIKIDKAFGDALKGNFDANVCPIVQVPLANDQNEHVENPGANLGEVLDIEVDDKNGKIYAHVDARKSADDFGKTLLGASAFMHLNYTDTTTNQKVGPTLLHVAVTNRPYVTQLDPYEEIVAASSEYEGSPALLEMSATSDQREAAVPRTLDEILAELKAEHELDVTALQEQLATFKTKTETAETALSAAQEELAAKPDVEELAAKVKAALTGTDAEVALSNKDGEIDTDTLVDAVSELAQQNVKLSSNFDAAGERILALEKRNVETEIDGLIDRGFIVPAKRETYLNLALSNRETFDALLPEEPIVALSVEKGVAPDAEAHQKQEIDVEAELARLTASDGPAAQYLTS
ncbi:MAG: hypothetical protein WC054_01010 [Candidatus Nanopelagicales bacterium]